MGGAIIKGIIKNGAADAKDVFVYDKNTSAVNALAEEYGIVNAETAKQAAKVDILFLAVKPNIICGVIDEIREYIEAGTIIVSIAAGQTINRLTNAFKCDTIKLVRVMPNTPALVGEGMAAVSFNDVMQKPENKAEADYIVSLFEALGRAETVPEKLMDTVTGVSGSSPAYIFMLIEAMADAAVLGGMPRNQAYVFAAQSVLGSAKMLLDSGKHPGELKDMVCSPAGTTIEAVKVLENEGFRSAVINAIEACIKKSESM